jgi:hypothetical protein
VVAALLAGCATSRFDYGPYLDHMPRSILVLPPLDESPEVDATYGCLCSVTRPLAERGYYVFPVAVVDRMLRENGLPTPGEMHQVPPTKLHEIFGADAILYLTVKDWGTSYQVIDSVTKVHVEGRLVDARTGTELWQGTERLQRGSGGGGNAVGQLAAALVGQVTATPERARELGAEANQALIGAGAGSLLLGPYHPEFERDQAARRNERAAAAQ